LIDTGLPVCGLRMSCRFSARCCWTLRVSADCTAWPRRHTGAKPGLFQERRRNLERDGLFAGAEWIRTSSTATDRQRFRGFVQVGAIHRRRDELIRAVAGVASNQSTCRAVVREAPLTGRSRWRHPGQRCRHGERIASAGSTFRISLPLAERGRVPQMRSDLSPTLG